MSILKDKYPVSDWVYSIKDIDVGDLLVYIDDDDNEVIVEYVGLPPTNIGSFGDIVVQRLGRSLVEQMNIVETVMYKYKSGISKNDSVYTEPRCTCGAKHTSNKKFHLKYCDLSEF